MRLFARDDADPEMLGPVEMIRYAEPLVRAQHRVLDEDYMFWGNLADYLNHAANIPLKTGLRPAGWREFNRAREIALGYVRMAAPRALDASAG